MSRRQLRWMVRLESVVIAVLGAVLGVGSRPALRRRAAAGRVERRAGRARGAVGQLAIFVGCRPAASACSRPCGRPGGRRGSTCCGRSRPSSPAQTPDGGPRVVTSGSPGMVRPAAASRVGTAASTTASARGWIVAGAGSPRPSGRPPCAPARSSRSSGRSSSQRVSCRYGQRVWKRQPAGGFAGDGRSPGSRIRSRVSSIERVRDRHRRHQRLRVRVQRRRRTASSDGACSTIAPRYITPTTSAMCRTTARSCAMTT